MEVSEGFWRDVSEILEEWLEYKAFFQETPGFSVSIFHQGSEVFQLNSGYRDLDRKKEVSRESVFRLASISKIFTAVAILRLREEGLLSLDDEVGDYLKWFDKNATIRQLLYHCSGLSREGKLGYWGSLEFPDDEELENVFEQDQKVFSTNERWKYSNAGYALLGQILEEVDGRNYGDIVQNMVSEAGLDRFFTDYSESIDNIAKGYKRKIPGEEIESIEETRTNALKPAAGIVTTPENVNRFLSALSQGVIVEEETWREMKRVQWELPSGDKWALGLKKINLKGRELLGHNGSFPGTESSAFHCPEEDLTVTLAMNRDNSGTSELVKGIFSMIFELQDLFEKAEDIPDKFTGRYFQRKGDFDIRKIGGKLIGLYPGLDRPMERCFKLEKIGEEKFRMEDGPGSNYIGEQVTFRENGKIFEVSSIESEKIDKKYTLEELWN